MKKIISFEKEISFSSMIGEITSISLDHTLNFVDSNSIRGNFIISGSYKMTEASTLEEKFSYDIPTEIDLSENLDLSTSKISIDDFTYEIINDDILKCNVDVLVEGVEEIVLEEEDKSVEVLDSNSDRECDGDKKEEKEIEIPIKEDIETVIEEEEESKDDTVIEEEIQNATVIEEKSIEEEMDIKRQKVMDFHDDVVEEVEAVQPEMQEETTTNIGSLFEAFDSTEETFTTYSVYIFRKEDTLDKVLNQYKITREALSEYNDLDCLEIGSKLIIPSTNE